LKYGVVVAEAVVDLVVEAVVLVVTLKIHL
jgi:hypothetical protein